MEISINYDAKINPVTHDIDGRLQGNVTKSAVQNEEIWKHRQALPQQGNIAFKIIQILHILIS